MNTFNSQQLHLNLVQKCKSSMKSSETILSSLLNVFVSQHVTAVDVCEKEDQTAVRSLEAVFEVDSQAQRKQKGFTTGANDSSQR